MTYVPLGKEYYVTKTKARIADLERQLLPHRADDLALRPKVTRVEARITDITCIVIEELERQLRSAKAFLARCEAQPLSPTNAAGLQGGRAKHSRGEAIRE